MAGSARLFPDPVGPAGPQWTPKGLFSLTLYLAYLIYRRRQSAKYIGDASLQRKLRAPQGAVAVRVVTAESPFVGRARPKKPLESAQNSLELGAAIVLSVLQGLRFRDS